MFSSILSASFFKATATLSFTMAKSGSSLPVYIKNTFSCFLFVFSFSCNSFFCNRQASRVNLFIRLRSTAVLKFLLETPTPNWSELLTIDAPIIIGRSLTKKYTLNGFTTKLFPSANNCSICFRLFSLSFFPSVNCLLTDNTDLHRIFLKIKIALK